MDTSRDPACGLVAAMDVHYLRSGEPGRSLWWLPTPPTAMWWPNIPR